MPRPVLERSYVRRLLDRILITDADLDAFCLDFFPNIHRRFSAGMDRVQKINLLIELIEDLENITHKLCEQYPDKFDLATKEGIESSVKRESSRRTLYGLAICALILIGALGLWGATRRRPSWREFENRPVIQISSVQDMLPPIVDMNKATLPFVGTIFDLDTHNPIFQAYLVLAGTDCETKTSQSGYFSFAHCEQMQLSRITSPRANILLPASKLWCKDVSLLLPPAAIVIYIDRKCNIFSEAAGIKPPPRRDIQKHEATIEELMSLCYRKEAIACHKLGIFLVGMHENHQARRYLARACELGSSDACILLEQVE